MTSECFGSRILRAAGILAVLGALVLPARRAAADACGYPFGSGRTAVVFNESTVLRAFDPVTSQTTVLGQGLTIKAFYSDEHALTLGATSVSIKTASGTSVQCSSALPAGTLPGCVSNPSIGCAGATDPAQRPLWPALFITDITGNTGNTDGDWQHGGTAHAPNRVCGVWKGCTVLIDQTVSPAKVVVTTASDPAKNTWNGIPDTPPGGFAALSSEGYGAEVVWNVDDPSLGLVAGHTYRLQFMVHDGDQNKTGGDVGEGCTVVTIAPPLRVHVIPETSHLCQGQTVQLCAQIDPSNPGIPPYTYLWSTGSTDRCITVPSPATGASASYSVQATDSFKQKASASSTVFG